MSNIADRLAGDDLKLATVTLENILSSKDRTKSEDVFNLVEKKLKTPLTKSVFQQALSANIAAGNIPGFYSSRGKFGGIFKGQKEQPTESKPMPPTVKENIIKKELPELKDIKLYDEPKNNHSSNEIISPISKKEIKNIEEPKPYLSGKREVLKKETLKNPLHDESQIFEMIVNGEKFRVPCNILYIKSLLKAFKAREIQSAFGNTNIENIILQGKKYFIDDVETFRNVLYLFLNASIIKNSSDPNREPSIDKLIDEPPVVLSERLLANG